MENWRFYCEYLENPLGIENAAPRFSWEWRGDGKVPSGQKSFRVTVRNEEGGLCWDSGEIESRRSRAVYGGEKLRSATGYVWEVTLALKDETVYSGTRRFETGLLSEEDWRAQWISAPSPQRGVSPLFRRSFTLEKIPRRGRVYLSGLGYAEASLNGHPLDDSRLDPGCTQYAKTILYRAFDVTPFMREGENVLAVELGEGWYGLDYPLYRQQPRSMPSWLGFPKLLCRVIADDTVIVSSPDGSWLTSEGGVRENHLFDGETYDARLEKTGWRLPGYIPNGWNPAEAAESPGGKLCCQIMPGIRETKRVEPAYIDYPHKTNGFTFVADMGVNIAGWAEISVMGAPGQKVVLRYAEVKNADGTINQDNLRGALATDTYILRGDGKETWHPRFTYHGFRYVQIELDPGVTLHSIRGVCVHSDVPPASDFSCDNKILRDVYRAVLRTELNNLHSLPTDCPQRVERQGWLNDMAVRGEEAVCNFDIVLLYEKWLNDIADEQDGDGAVPDTAPFVFGQRPALHISSTYLLLPWYVYLYYGDDTLIKLHYDGMCRYVRHKLGTRGSDGLLPEAMYVGDWAPPMIFSVIGKEQNAVPSNVSHSFLATSYLYFDCQLMVRFAQILGLKDQEALYTQTAGEVKSAINSAFLNEKTGYGNGSQSENVFALFLNLMPSEARPAVLSAFLRDLREEHNMHITTGNQMTKYLFEVLGAEGLADDAFTVLTREDYPSFGFMLSHGATTIWERWEHMVSSEMNSHDHPMLGAFSVWFQKYLAGIRMEYSSEKGLFLRIAPQLPKNLSSAGAEMRVPEGRAACKWVFEGGQARIDVSVPWNGEAVFVVPAFDRDVTGITVNGARERKVTRDEISLNAGHYEIILHTE